jgi:hypothetical protein
MSNITVQNVAMRMLKYIGVRQLGPEPAGSQLETVQPGDLDDVATAITGAMQEVFESAPDEMREQRMGSVLYAPVSATVSAAQFSTAIGNFAAFQSYMPGCTVRLAGDAQDNELVSQTALARPFMGTTSSSIAITVFHDCLTLDPGVDHVSPPVELPNQAPLYAANDRLDFMRWVGVPLITDPSGNAIDFPFYYYYQRTVSRPRAWFAEGWYDPAQTQYIKRLRFGPMPDTSYPVAYRVALCPPRYTSADIAAPGDNTYADPGAVIPVSNSWVETILLPVALQRFTAHPAFKNESAKAEIARQYKLAIEMAQMSTIARNPNRSVRYI